MAIPASEAGVQIFVEHWGGDNLQFYPNFALFSTLGGMNLDHDFFKVSKLSEEQTKNVFTKNGTIFSSNSGEDQKKGLHQKWNQARSQKFALGGLIFGSWGGAPSARKFCIFLQK